MKGRHRAHCPWRWPLCGHTIADSSLYRARHSRAGAA